jgi:5,6-dimethylbenzimidazole synthase
LKKILLIPQNVNSIAYLSLGYVTEFADKPGLEKAGWLLRLKLNDVVCYENWGQDIYEKDYCCWLVGF